MTIPPRFEWQRAPRRERSYVRWIAIGAAILVAFALGVALGQALNDNPSGSGNVTFVTTLQTATP